MEHTLENQLDSLKERTLGIEVFERDPRYDTNQDPVVRSTAGEVRKRLAQYYLEPGREEELRIALPPGSYIPEIHPPPERVPSTTQAQPAPRPFPWKRAGVAAVGVALAATVAVLFLALRRTGLDRFWDPVVSAPGQVLICVGQPRTYGFAARKQGRLETWLEKRATDEPPPPDLAMVPFDEIVPLWDRYIALSDAQVYERMARVLTGKGKATELRGNRSVSLSELRGKPLVLIGAFNNEWTLSLAGELRFFFQTDPAHHAELVRDRRNPDKTDWRVINAWPNRRISADYAIVSRVRNPTTEQTVVIVAGITGFGTVAAGEMVTNEEYFRQALEGAPKDWQQKNMQIVLSVKVMSGTGGPPQVVERYFW